MLIYVLYDNLKAFQSGSQLNNFHLQPKLYYYTFNTFLTMLDKAFLEIEQDFQGKKTTIF